MSEAASASAAERRSEEEVGSLVREVILELVPVTGQPAAEDDTRLIENLGHRSQALLELAFSLEDECDLTPIDEQTAQSIIAVKAVQEHAIAELVAREVVEGGES